MAYKSNKIETPKYTVLKSYDDFELRQYGSMILAQTVMQSASYENTSSQGFRTVASYIFGGNETESQIKMTAPVFMQSKSGQNTMMFYMPSKYSLDTLPEPNSQEVELGTISFGKVAVIKYSGFNPMRKRKANFEKLMNWIEKKGLEIYDNEFYSAGYDSPWTLPWKRKNEVMVLVK